MTTDPVVIGCYRVNADYDGLALKEDTLIGVVNVARRNKYRTPNAFPCHERLPNATIKSFAADILRLAFQRVSISRPQEINTPCERQARPSSTIGIVSMTTVHIPHQIRSTGYAVAYGETRQHFP
jgi:hypothetical protein